MPNTIDAKLLMDPDALGEATTSGIVEFDEALTQAWQVRESLPGVMRSSHRQITRRYAVRSDGSLGRYVVQSNPGRGARRAPARSFERVVEPFDEAAFHFVPARIKAEEVLMRWRFRDMQLALLVNVNPLGFGHSLLVIDPLGLRAQVLEEEGLRAAHCVAMMSKRLDFKLGFNSLAACASVNHYHFQCLYFHGGGIHADCMPSEQASVLQWATCPGIGELADYPTHGWSVDEHAPGGLAHATAEVASVLQANNVPHNVLLTGDRAIVIPRIHPSQADSSLDKGMAFLEMHGEMLVVGDSSEHADALALCLTEQDIARRIRALDVGREAFNRLSCAIVDRVHTR